MISLPDFNKAFEYENDFYWTSPAARLGKCIAHYELFKLVNELQGDIIECGVFKGASLLRFASFQAVFGKLKKKVIGFDTFGVFPETKFESDKSHRKDFIEDAGAESIGKEQLLSVVQKKGLQTEVELVEGDVVQMVPSYVKTHHGLKISLLNLDTDIYEPAVTILTHLYPLIVEGGVLISDDYRVFPGETKAIDDFFKGKDVKIQNFPNLKTPHFIIKKGAY